MYFRLGKSQCLKLFLFQQNCVWTNSRHGENYTGRILSCIQYILTINEYFLLSFNRVTKIPTVYKLPRFFTQLNCLNVNVTRKIPHTPCSTTSKFNQWHAIFQCYWRIYRIVFPLLTWSIKKMGSDNTGNNFQKNVYWEYFMPSIRFLICIYYTLI